MVSVGTIFSLAVIGAVAAGGYAVYRNTDKIGGALTRGLEKNVVSPFGNYIDNLWKDAGTNIVSTTTSSVQKQIVKPLENISNPLTVFTNPLPSAYATKPKQTLPPPTIKSQPTPNAPKLISPKAKTPKELLNMLPSKAGWYYQNYSPESGREDRQIKLNKGSADALRKRGWDLTYLTPKNKLSPKAFEMFGKSQNYL